ncbi:MAG: RnfH family protein [Litorivicinaceae bacterium]
MTTPDGDPSFIVVEVAFALPERQKIIRLSVPEGTTMAEAAALSGITEHFPEIDLDTIPMGIFGVEVKTATTTVLSAGDRVELYRSLTADPKESRRRRAQANSRDPDQTAQ